MKRFLALIIALVLVMSVTAMASTETTMYDNGMTYGEGYPITKDVVELDAWVSYSVQQNVSEMVDVPQYILDKTNIKLNLTIVYESDETAMMLASGDFPDFVMNAGVTDMQRLNAVEAGDVICLDDYMEFMPSWKAVFEKYELSDKMTLIEGKRYTLPWCNFDYSDRNMRDSIIINGAWLKELGLEKPTTIADFTNCLQMFKDNAGNGTIPENVIPFLFKFGGGWWNGGEHHLFSQFGVYCGCNEWIYAEGGQCVYQAINPLCKDALKWLQELYSTGLITPETFTDHSNYYSRVCATDPELVGAYVYYTGYRMDVDEFIGPLDSGNGQVALMNSQTYTPNSPHNAMIFSTTEYPVAICRLLEWTISSPEVIATVDIGSEGHMWKWNDEGKIEQIGDQQDSAMLPHRGFWNTWVGVLDPEIFYDSYQINSFTDGGIRKLRWYDTYLGKTVPTENNYVGANLDVDKTAAMNEYWTDIENYRKETWTNWITTDADIDAEWDAYVSGIEALHLADWLALKQESYDILH